jgi:hypothetical protein
MPPISTIRGRVVDLRRYINVNAYRRNPLAPPERYELWLRQFDGLERKFIFNTGTMAARRGHGISLFLNESASPSRVLAVFNRENGASTNYLRSDPPASLRLKDFIVLAIAFAVMNWRLGEAGLVLCACVAPIYLLVAALGRAVKLELDAREVDCMIAQEHVRAGMRSKSP